MEATRDQHDMAIDEKKRRKTLKEIAHDMDGGIAGFEILEPVDNLAEKNNYVIIFCRDDRISIRGAINCDTWNRAYDGRIQEIYITDDGRVSSKSPVDAYVWYKIKISRKFPDTDQALTPDKQSTPPFWKVEAHMPHEIFTIYRRVECRVIYCEGIIFELG